MSEMIAKGNYPYPVIQQELYNDHDNSVSAPLFMTSTFQNKTTANPDRGEHTYARMKNPNFSIFEGMVKELYNVDTCLLSCSGISSIASVLDCYSDSMDESVFLVSNELYRDTERFINYLCKRKPLLKVISIDVTDSDTLMKHVADFAQSLKVVFLECCTNPTGMVADFDLLKSIKGNSPSCKIVVDNCWMTGALFNPFIYGADIVVESVSKYVSGGRVIMGYALGNRRDMSELIEYTDAYGLRPSQFDCWLTADAMQTLPMRVNYLSDITQKVALFLEQHPKVKVLYPMLSSHPTFENARKYFGETGGPAIIYFWIPLKKELAESWCDSHKHILFATSYGKSHSMFDPYLKEKKEGDQIGTWIRLSVGWASRQDQLIKDLDESLNRLSEEENFHYEKEKQL